MSRLPAPSTQIGGGLSEWSESQHNARIQSSVPAPTSWKGLKREIPQPGTFFYSVPPALCPHASLLLTASRIVNSRPVRSQAQTTRRPRTRIPSKAVTRNCRSCSSISGQGPDFNRHIRCKLTSSFLCVDYAMAPARISPFSLWCQFQPCRN